MIRTIGHTGKSTNSAAKNFGVGGGSFASLKDLEALKTWFNHPGRRDEINKPAMNLKYLRN